MAKKNEETTKEKVLAGQIGWHFLPNESRDDLSQTSVAIDCFVDQQFSGKLQDYLLNYRIFITSNLSVNDE